jgi:hypothetical protein
MARFPRHKKGARRLNSPAIAESGWNCYRVTMPFNVRTTASIAGTILLLSFGVCVADNAAPRPPASVPVKQPTYRLVSPKTSELPPSALGIDTKSRGYEPGDDKSDLKVPDQIKFGNNTLHFDATKKDPVPPVGLEANGESVLNKAPAEPALKPSYLGLRLTTPMNLFER